MKGKEQPVYQAQAQSYINQTQKYANPHGCCKKPNRV